MITALDAQQRAEAACERIVAALEALPLHACYGVALSMALDADSPSLQTIGDSYLSGDPPSKMARDLLAWVLLGDVQPTAARLGDSEPWGVIRRALSEIEDVWRASHSPHAKTAHDWRAVRRRWERERRANAASVSERHTAPISTSD